MARFSDYKEIKLSALRLGQAVCERVELKHGDKVISLCLVPLNEGEYENSLEAADMLMAGENPAGMSRRDEAQRVMVIFHAARVDGSLEEKFFDDVTEVAELNAHELNHLYDVYLEMVALNSPAMMGMSEEDFLGLKLALPQIEWSELSGPQWYAAQRFLNSIRPLLLTGKSSGSLSTVKSTPTKND